MQHRTCQEKVEGVGQTQAVRQELQRAQTQLSTGDVRRRQRAWGDTQTTFLRRQSLPSWAASARSVLKFLQEQRTALLEVAHEAYTAPDDQEPQEHMQQAPRRLMRGPATLQIAEAAAAAAAVAGMDMDTDNSCDRCWRGPTR